MRISSLTWTNHVLKDKDRKPFFSSALCGCSFGTEGMVGKKDT